MGTLWERARGREPVVERPWHRDRGIADRGIETSWHRDRGIETVAETVATWRSDRYRG